MCIRDRQLSGIVSGDAALGSQLTNTITINDNDFDGFSGPGGVGDDASNLLWLKADSLTYNDGQSVSSWPDVSGNNNDFTQAVPGLQTVFDSINPLANNMPSLHFDGIDDLIDGPNITSGTGGKTVFLIASEPSVDNGVMLELNNGPLVNNTHFAVTASRISVRANQGYYETFQRLSTTDFGLISVSHPDNANTLDMVIHYDGVLQSRRAGNNRVMNLAAGNATLGWSPQFTNYFNGDLSEVIVYNRQLNNTQRIIVENYLAAKYDIDISGGSQDRYIYETTHAGDLAGIGQYAANDYHTAAMSAAMLKISLASSMDIGDYMLFGHDNADFSTWVNNEVPGDSIRRIEREWRFDKTNDPGSVTLSLDPSLLPAAPAGYTFYVAWLDSDGDFTSGARSVPLTFNGSEYEASGVDIQDGDYLAIGIIRPYVEFLFDSSSGDESSSPASIEATLSYPLGSDITVDYTVYGGTASGAGTDYDVPGSTLTIPAGSLTASFPLNINDDAIPENDETVFFRLSNPSAGLDIGSRDTTVFSIIDNDNPRLIDFTLASSAGPESDITVDLTVRINIVDNTNPTSVDYTVSGGTATGGGSDYILASGTATVLPGNLATTIRIDVIDDAIFEADETIELSLSNPINSNLGANQIHTYSIQNDDSKPELVFEISGSTTSEGVGSTSVTALSLIHI
jgi:hypothetical protein